MKKSFYRGENSISKLLCTLRKWSVWCYSQKQKFRWLKISKSERERILNVHFAECCTCGKEAQVSTRVIHRCHLPGKVFGMAHSKCNLQARTTNFLPVFFHNFSRYDSHHSLKTLKLEKSEKLSAIARTDETVTSINLSMPVGSYTEFLEHLHQIMSQLNVFATGGSGWVVEKMERFEIKTAKCATVVAGSYIETPPILPFDPKHIWKMCRSYISLQNKCPCHSLVFDPLKLEIDAQSMSIN